MRYEQFFSSRNRQPLPTRSQSAPYTEDYYGIRDYPNMRPVEKARCEYEEKEYHLEKKAILFRKSNQARYNSRIAALEDGLHQEQERLHHWYMHETEAAYRRYRHSRMSVRELDKVCEKLRKSKKAQMDSRVKWTQQQIRVAQDDFRVKDERITTEFSASLKQVRARIYAAKGYQ